MPRTVLVVDSKRDTNDLLAGLVRPRGFDPIQVFSGEAALTEVGRHRPDLILLDLALSDMSGFDLCDLWKRERGTNLVPIIMLTSHPDAKERVAGVRVGANGYLIKPFTPEELYALIDEGFAWHEEHLKRGTTGEINFDIRSEQTYLAQASDLLADLFAHTPLTERHIKDLKQAVMEMGGNAIEWGHGKNAELVLRITYQIDSNAVTLIIRDQGPGFDPTDIPHAASEEDPIGHLEIRNAMGRREGGFGIMLAKGLVDKFRYNDRGNEVTIVKYFRPEVGKAD